VPKRSRIAGEPVSDRKSKSNQVFTIRNSINKGLLTKNQNQNKRQPSEDVELPFQQGAPLREDDMLKLYNPDREIFMAILSESEDRKDDPAERVDLVDYNSSDYDEFLSDAEATEQWQSTMKFLHRHQESQ